MDSYTEFCCVDLSLRIHMLKRQLISVDILCFINFIVWIYCVSLQWNFYIYLRVTYADSDSLDVDSVDSLYCHCIGTVCDSHYFILVDKQLKSQPWI